MVALLALSIACADKAANDHAVATAAGPAPQAARMTPLDHVTWESTRLALAPAIVVVDLWASWCVPCLERFPKMIELHNKYSNQGVQFVSLSLDDRDSPADLQFARDFLSRQNAPFPHFLLDEEMLEGFEKIGIRGVPAVDIYDRDGQLALRLTGDDPNDQFADSDVERALIALLGQQP